MLGIRLKPEEEERLERHARDLGRPKSAIVREWIVERLERDSVDAQLRRAAQILAASERDRQQRPWVVPIPCSPRSTIDGGYDWGPEGPPA
ncbi:ribbon-helix-helix protein, CopG family [Sphingomonas sp. MMS24-JH45]